VLHLYSADRAEPLARKLAEVLIDDPGDPMDAEWLAVPSDGMRRWLVLELARHLGATTGPSSDGVAANIIRAYPATLRSAVLDADSGGRPDPWHIDRMVWPLSALFDRLEREGTLPAFTRLPDGGSRFTRVRLVADLVDRYHLHRPEMVRRWVQGDLVDGNLEPINGHASWQPELWRMLRAAIQVESPPERMPRILADLREDRLAVELPRRLLFFGFSTLPGRGFLDLVEAVGRHRDVHVFLLEPHHVAPGVLRGEWSPSGDPGRRPLTTHDPGQAQGNPLLRTWGRLPRETALLLADAHSPDLPEPIVVSREPVPQPITLLQRLQAGIRADAVPTAAEVAPGDRSVQFHACFGPTREVEVARDVILHLLNAPGSDLTEEDVLVVCPGLDRFAPLVEAVFGTLPSPGAGSDPAADAPGLRYRIADRSVRTANPVMGATAALLELVSGRFELTAVLEFLSLAPVRERFRFDDSDLGVIAEWAEDTLVRWGLDPVHRSRFGIPGAVDANTWQRALDRLLIGSATSDTDVELAVGGIAPRGVEIGDAEVLGSFASILARLAALAEWSVGASGHRRPVLAEWIEELRQACRDLFLAPAQATWQTEALERVFADLLDAAGDASVDATCGLDLLDLRRLLDDRLGDEPGRPDFFRGGVTVTSLTPLRWVPFRVVCILGLDQEFVVTATADAADLVAASPRIGDPDARAEFRQSILEAVLAAGDHLVVVRDGRDVRSNHTVPPVVPVAELLETLVALGADAGPGGAVGGLEVMHPRHPFDEPCLTPDGIVPGLVWSFDPEDLDGAIRRRARPSARTPFMTTPLAADDDDVLELAELRAFLADPVSRFVARALEVTLPRVAEDVDVTLPVEPNGLELHQLGKDLLESRSAGATDAEWRSLARAKGAFPPGVLEERTASDLISEVDEMMQEATIRGLRPGDPELFPIDLVLPSGARIIGEVPLQLGPGRAGPGRIRFTRPKAVDVLDAWLDLMVLGASEPATSWRALVVTRAAGKGKPLEPVDLVASPAPEGTADPHGYQQAVALAALDTVVDLYRRGMREPLPLFPTYSRLEYEGGAGHTAWRSYDGRGDATGAAVRLVFGDIDVEELEELPARPDDPGADHDGAGRAVRLAHHLWGTVDASVERVP